MKTLEGNNRTKAKLLILLSVAVITLCLYQRSTFTKWTDKVYTFATKYDPKILTLNQTTMYRNLPVLEPLNFSIQEFFSTDLVEHPGEANKLSVRLTTRSAVIQEAQRIHMNIFKTLLGKYKYAMFFHYSLSENKGDSAITVAEFMLLQKLNIEVIFACYEFDCQSSHLQKALSMSKNYTNEELVILLQGGGNFIGYPNTDKWRAAVIKLFPKYHIVMFPQGILYIENQSHIDFCKDIYASHRHLTFLWRDNVSYKLGKSLFSKVNNLLSPDIAYQIGSVPRFMHPTQDILWIKRNDKETPSYTIPPIPPGLRVHFADWLTWKTQGGTSPMENAFLRTTNGLTFLQRGRIVITDRLHGHILSTLLGIPHVFIDNKYRKVSNYHNTWTASVENIVFANSSIDALLQAQRLLTKLDKQLPKPLGPLKKN